MSFLTSDERTITLGDFSCFGVFPMAPLEVANIHSIDTSEIRFKFLPALLDFDASLLRIIL